VTDIPKQLLIGTRSVVRLDAIPPVTIAYRITPGLRGALNAGSRSDVLTGGLPRLLTPAFAANSYFVRIGELHYRSRMPLVRISVKLFDLRNRKFVAAFRHSLGSDVREQEFATDVQKGASVRRSTLRQAISRSRLVFSLRRCTVCRRRRQSWSHSQ
jgi:hypothetical protein